MAIEEASEALAQIEAARAGRHPLHPAPVHRHPRRGQGRHDPDPPARGLGPPRHLVRRLVHRGLHPDRRVATSTWRPTWRRSTRSRGSPAPAARGTARVICDVFTPARRAVHRRPALRAPPPGRARPQARLRRQHRPGARVLPVPARRRRPDRAPPPRPGRLLRLLDRPRPGGPPGHGGRAGGVRDQRRGRPPRGRGRPARDRLRVRRRAQDRRQRDHVQVRAQGDRPAARPVRDVHAQADPRDQRLGDAHPPEPVLDRRRPERVRRREGALRPVATSRAATWPGSSPTPAA